MAAPRTFTPHQPARQTSGTHPSIGVNGLAYHHLSYYDREQAPDSLFEPEVHPSKPQRLVEETLWKRTANRLLFTKLEEVATRFDSSARKLRGEIASNVTTLFRCLTKERRVKKVAVAEYPIALSPLSPEQQQGEGTSADETIKARVPVRNATVKSRERWMSRIQPATPRKTTPNATFEPRFTASGPHTHPLARTAPSGFPMHTRDFRFPAWEPPTVAQIPVHHRRRAAPIYTSSPLVTIHEAAGIATPAAISRVPSGAQTASTSGSRSRTDPYACTYSGAHPSPSTSIAVNMYYSSSSSSSNATNILDRRNAMTATRLPVRYRGRTRFPGETLYHQPQSLSPAASLAISPAVSRRTSSATQRTTLSSVDEEDDLPLTTGNVARSTTRVIRGVEGSCRSTHGSFHGCDEIPENLKGSLDEMRVW